MGRSGWADGTPAKEDSNTNRPYDDVVWACLPTGNCRTAKAVGALDPLVRGRHIRAAETVPIYLNSQRGP